MGHTAGPVRALTQEYVLALEAERDRLRESNKSLAADLQFERQSYENLKAQMVATLEYIVAHPPSGEWLAGLNEVREAAATSGGAQEGK